jgi:hypothetical protein
MERIRLFSHFDTELQVVPPDTIVLSETVKAFHWKPPAVYQVDKK